MPKTTEPKESPLQVAFEAPDSGWISFGVTPLGRGWDLRASNVEDPFPDLIAWLEAIIDGADLARWRVCEEGSLAQFIFVAETRELLDESPAQLILMRSSSSGAKTDLANCNARAAEVVSAFYGAFRAMTQSAYYSAGDWDEAGDVQVGEPGVVTDGEFCRPTLASLRSLKVEAFLQTLPPSTTPPKLDQALLTEPSAGLSGDDGAPPTSMKRSVLI